jgi:hypothetical protein
MKASHTDSTEAGAQQGIISFLRLIHGSGWKEGETLITWTQDESRRTQAKLYFCKSHKFHAQAGTQNFNQLS